MHEFPTIFPFGISVQNVIKNAKNYWTQISTNLVFQYKCLPSKILRKKIVEEN